MIRNEPRGSGELAAGEVFLSELNRMGDGGVKEVAEERGFSSAARAGDHDQPPEGQAKIKSFLVAKARGLQCEPSHLPGFGFQRPVFTAQRVHDAVGEKKACKRLGIAPD